MNTDEYRIEINLAEQSLKLLKGDELLQQYPVSTARNGAGEMIDSECTPRGQHIIAEKIGEGCALNSVFVGRQETGEIFSQEMAIQHPQRDWILTRILRLRGLEAGRNLNGDVDSYARYIYIHGTPDTVDISTPGSHGCIRLRNRDIVELFDLVDKSTPVNISEK
ncbi:MAG: L,D-transpeptidase family protein [Gammaproteobacteria bacterium]|nr:L,D-transpeptidase family protein [Gammaproteobacteria bacterium]